MGAGSLLSQVAATAAVTVVIASEGCLIALVMGLGSGRSPLAVPARRLACHMAWLAVASAVVADVAAALGRELERLPPTNGFITVECALAACAGIWLVMLWTFLRPHARA